VRVSPQFIVGYLRGSVL